MNGFTLHYADGTNVKNNCNYPHTMQVTDEESLRKATGHDYVCVLYQNGYRSNANFISANCLGMDCDNDHSENPEDWVTLESIQQIFPDVAFAVHFSRNHMKPKRGNAARPKFHCLFCIDEMTDPDAYRALKRRVQRVCPFFDSNALDAARFFFGTEQPEVEFHPGTLTLNEYLDHHYPDSGHDLTNGTAPSPQVRRCTILEGSRNITMSMFAGSILKRYGDTEHAYHLFLEEANQCVSPLIL